MWIENTTDIKVEETLFAAILSGSSIWENTDNTANQRNAILKLVVDLTPDQRNDFLWLIQQWFCSIPEWSNVNDFWKFLLTLTPEEFKEYYKICSKKREVTKGVKNIITKA